MEQLRLRIAELNRLGDAFSAAPTYARLAATYEYATQHVNFFCAVDPMTVRMLIYDWLEDFELVAPENDAHCERARQAFRNFRFAAASHNVE